MLKDTALILTNGQLATAVEQLRRAYEFNTSASVVQLWYSGALLNLGEFDSAADVARSTNKLLPMALAGRYEEGSEHFDSLQGLLYDEGTLSGIGDWMLLRDRPDELIAFLEELAGEGKDWLEQQPRPDQLWGAHHMTNVAYALQAIDRTEEAERVLTETREILDTQADYGANNMFYWWNEAEYAALTGDVEAMLSSLRKSIERLPDREGRILALRYGFYDGVPRTLEEIGDEFNLTRERIRQLEKLALCRLRHPSFGIREQDLL